MRVDGSRDRNAAAGQWPKLNCAIVMKHFSFFRFFPVPVGRARRRPIRSRPPAAPSLACIVLAALAASGCGSRNGSTETTAGARVVGPEYSASKGLYVPEETRRSLALQLVDVAEQPVAGSLEIPLRIYRVGVDCIRASGQIAGDVAPRLTPGREVTVSAVAGRVIPARVSAVRPALGATSATREILVEIPAASGLTVGEFVRGTVSLRSTDAAAAVPRDAVVQSTEGPFVYTLSGEHFVRTAVKLGTMTTDVVEIADGLYAGDQVVARGAMALWLTELAAIKGGHSCCVVPPKGSE